MGARSSALPWLKLSRTADCVLEVEGFASVTLYTRAAWLYKFFAGILRCGGRCLVWDEVRRLLEEAVRPEDFEKDFSDEESFVKRIRGYTRSGPMKGTFEDSSPAAAKNRRCAFKAILFVSRIDKRYWFGLKVSDPVIDGERIPFAYSRPKRGPHAQSIPAVPRAAATILDGSALRTEDQPAQDSVRIFVPVGYNAHFYRLCVYYLPLLYDHLYVYAPTSGGCRAAHVSPLDFLTLATKDTAIVPTAFPYWHTKERKDQLYAQAYASHGDAQVLELSSEPFFEDALEAQYKDATYTFDSKPVKRGAEQRDLTKQFRDARFIEGFRAVAQPDYLPPEIQRAGSTAKEGVDPVEAMAMEFLTGYLGDWSIAKRHGCSAVQSDPNLQALYDFADGFVGSHEILSGLVHPPTGVSKAPAFPRDFKPAQFLERVLNSMRGPGFAPQLVEWRRSGAPQHFRAFIEGFFSDFLDKPRRPSAEVLTDALLRALKCDVTAAQQNRRLLMGTLLREIRDPAFVTQATLLAGEDEDGYLDRVVSLALGGTWISEERRMQILDCFGVYLDPRHRFCYSSMLAPAP